MTQNNKNFFVVNRGLLSSDRWLSEPFTRGQAWIDLFGLANHADGFIRVRGLKIPVKRGQLGWSQLKLSERWSWSRNKVRRYLKELEENQDITIETIQQKARATSLITVIKYNQWQLKGTTEGTTDGHQTEQQTDIKRYCNKKNKKNKKKENTIASPEANADQIVSVIEKFHTTELNTTLKYGNKTQRKAAGEMIDQFGVPAINKIIDFLSSEEVINDPYSPRVTTPHQLQQKWGLIRQYFAKLQGKQLKNKITIIE